MGEPIQGLLLGAIIPNFAGLGIYFLLASLVLAFQNCGPQKDEDNISRLSSTTCQTKQYVESVALDKNVHLKRIFSKASSEPVDIDLRIDTHCAQQSTGLSHSLVTTQMLSSKTKTISYQTADLAATIKEIDSDECILGAYQHSSQVFKIQQAQPEINYPLSNDPFANQAYFKTMGFARGQLRFFDPQLGIDPNLRVTVAVIDTGVDYNHPDLANVMWDDGNGNHGIRLYDGALTPLDDDLHGTHVAGIIGAQSNNGIGVRSIAGNIAEIMAINGVNGPNDLGFSPQSIADAIDFAIANQAQIINLSLGGPGPENPLIVDAIVRALNSGIFIVAAAGNDNMNANNTFPAANSVALTGILSVGSIDTDLKKSTFSNFGNSVDILASGNEANGRVNRSILSTFPQGQYNRIAGTSMATPVTAAAAALTIAFLETYNLPYNPAMLEQILLASARQEPTLATVARDGRVLDLDTLSATLYRLANIPNDPVVTYDTQYLTAILNQPTDDIVIPTPSAEVCP